MRTFFSGTHCDRMELNSSLLLARNPSSWDGVTPVKVGESIELICANESRYNFLLQLSSFLSVIIQCDAD